MTNGVAMPSFSPLSMLSERRILTGTALSVTTAMPSAASVGASTAAMRAASAQVTPGTTSIAHDRSEHEGEEQPDAEQTSRDTRVTLQDPQRHGRRVGEQQRRERQLGERQHDVTPALHVEQIGSFGTERQPCRDEHHGGADPQSIEAP